MNTLDYTARVKRVHHIESDYALAKLMGISRATVSAWTTLGRTLDTRNCYRVAELLGLDAQLVVADIERERAEKAGKPEDVDYWRGWVKKLGGKVGGVVAAVLLGAGITGPAPSNASTGAGCQASGGHDTHCRASWHGSLAF